MRACMCVYMCKCVIAFNEYINKIELRDLRTSLMRLQSTKKVSQIRHVTISQSEFPA